MIDFSEAKRRYLQTLHTDGLSAKSITSHRQALDHLEYWCTKRGLEPMNVTAAERDAYLAEFATTHSKAYTRNRRIFIDRFFLRAVDRGWGADVGMAVHSQRTIWAPTNESDPDQMLVAIGEFADYLLAQGRSERTAQNYCYLLFRFRSFLMRRKIDWRTITLQQLMSFQSTYRMGGTGYRSSRTTKPKVRSATTVALMTTCLRSFYRWSVKTGYLAVSPAAELEMPKRNRPLPRHLSPSIVHKLVTLLNNPPDDLTEDQRQAWQRNRMIILVLLYTGMRLSECAALTWEDLDFDYNQIKVLRKGNKEQHIPVNELLCKELLAYRNGATSGPIFLSRKTGRLTDEGISEMFRRFVQGQLGIRCTAHQLRHTVATWLINAEAKPELIQLLLGHEDLRTTMRYAEVDAARVRTLVNQLPATSNWQQQPAGPSTPGMTLEGMQFLSNDPTS